MMYKTHLAFALFIGFLFSPFVPFQTFFPFLFFVALGSLLPDVDHPESFLGKNIRPVSTFFVLIFGHRGIFHSLFIPIFLYVFFVLFLNFPLVGIGLTLGYLSHLISDAFTPQGIGFFHPLIKYRVRGFITT